MSSIVLVTGANGFVGHALCKKLLSQGYRVIAIATNASDLNDLACSSLEVHVGYYRDYHKIESEIGSKVDYAFHLAWQGVWQKNLQTDYDLQIENAIYCGRAFEMAKRLGARRFVMVSTVNIFETINVIESPVVKNPLRPGNLYALGKITGETICKYLASNCDTSFNCAYLPMVYGPGNKSLIVVNVAMAKLLQNIDVDLVKGEGDYDIVYIDDVVDGLVAIAEKGARNKGYYIGNRAVGSFKRLFERMKAALSSTSKLNFGAYPGDNDLDYSKIDLNALYEDTGFASTSSFEESIRLTAQWLKNNDYLGVK